MSLSVFISPNTKTGTTTIANYAALNIAKKTNEMVLLIEFSRYTGRSIYMQRQVLEKRRSLKNVVLNPTDFTILQENIMLSKNNKNLYFLSMNLYEDFLEMKSYASTSLTRLITNARTYFQHIVIDLPSNSEEPVVGATFSPTFGHKIDNIFMVLDEDVLTYKMLYDFSAVLRLGNAEPLHVTYVINKITKYYIDFVEDHLDLPLIKPLNLIKLPSIEEMVDCCNKGTPLNIGRGKYAKDFLNNIEKITKIALSGQRGTDPMTGVGIKVKKKSNRSDDTENNNEGQNKKQSKRKKDRNKKSKQQQTPQSQDQQLTSEQPILEQPIQFQTPQPQPQQPQPTPQQTYSTPQQQPQPQQPIQSKDPSVQYSDASVLPQAPQQREPYTPKPYTAEPDEILFESPVQQPTPQPQQQQPTPQPQQQQPQQLNNDPFETSFEFEDISPTSQPQPNSDPIETSFEFEDISTSQSQPNIQPNNNSIETSFEFEDISEQPQSQPNIQPNNNSIETSFEFEDIPEQPQSFENISNTPESNINPTGNNTTTSNDLGFETADSSVYDIQDEFLDDEDFEIKSFNVGGDE